MPSVTSPRGALEPQMVRRGDPRRTLLQIAWIAVLLGVPACGGRSEFSDTDAELFRSQEQLTGARELNLAARVSRFYREKGRLPQGLGELDDTAQAGPPGERLSNDAWGRPLRIDPVGSGLEIRSAGRDTTYETVDDIVYRVERADSIP